MFVWPLALAVNALGLPVLAFVLLRRFRGSSQPRDRMLLILLNTGLFHFQFWDRAPKLTSEHLRDSARLRSLKKRTLVAMMMNIVFLPSVVLMFILVEGSINGFYLTGVLATFMLPQLLCSIFIFTSISRELGLWQRRERPGFEIIEEPGSP